MAKESVAGWFGGVTGIMVGQPFDTVKARLQTQGVGGRELRYSSAFHCCADIVKTEGVRGLYKGMSSPLVGVALITAVAFGTHERVMRALQPEGGDPIVMNSFIAGAVAGGVQSFICCPTELIKLRMQMQGIGRESPLSLFPFTYQRHKAPPTLPTSLGSLQTVGKIFRESGVRGLNKGMMVTMLREVPAFSTYFGVFDFLRKQIATIKDRPVDSLSPILYCLAGGTSGTLAWVVTYPFDVIKSRLQTDGVGEPPQYKGIVDCGIKSYRASGVRIFFVGLNTTLIRAFPVNATTFLTVALILQNW